MSTWKLYFGFGVRTSRLPFDFAHLGAVEYPVGEFRWADSDNPAQTLSVSPETPVPEKPDHPIGQFCFCDIVINETISPVAISPLKETGIERVKGSFRPLQVMKNLLHILPTPFTPILSDLSNGGHFLLNSLDDRAGEILIEDVTAHASLLSARSAHQLNALQFFIRMGIGEPELVTHNFSRQSEGFDDSLYWHAIVGSNLFDRASRARQRLQHHMNEHSRSLKRRLSVADALVSDDVLAESTHAILAHSKLMRIFGGCRLFVRLRHTRASICIIMSRRIRSKLRRYL